VKVQQASAGSTKAPLRVFVSYNHADKAMVRRMVLDLRAEGVDTWFDELEMKPGDSLLYRISDAIESMDLLIVALSPESVNSSWVKQELEMAMTLQLAEGRVRVIPVVLKDCVIPLFLRGKLWLDFRQPEKYWRNVVQLLDSIIPDRKLNYLTAKEAARLVKVGVKPRGQLCGMSQQGISQQYISATTMSERDWVHADVKSGRSRIWVIDYYDDEEREYISHGVYDGQVTSFPVLHLHGDSPVPIDFNFSDSDRAVSAAVNEALRVSAVPNEEDFFVMTRLRFYSQTGHMWEVSFFDEALRRPTGSVQVDPRTGLAGKFRFPDSGGPSLNIPSSARNGYSQSHPASDTTRRMVPLTEFIQQIMTDQGIPADLDPEVRAQYEADLAEFATDLINRRLIEAMPDQTVEHFNALLDTDPTSQAIQEFVQYNVPNLEYVTAEALLELRRHYLGDKA
jgi:TIR domain